MDLSEKIPLNREKTPGQQEFLEREEAMGSQVTKVVGFTWKCDPEDVPGKVVGFFKKLFRG